MSSGLDVTGCRMWPEVTEEATYLVCVREGAVRVAFLVRVLWHEACM